MALPLTFIQPSTENMDYYLYINIFLSIITLLMIITVASVCFLIICNVSVTIINYYRGKKTTPIAEVEPFLVQKKRTNHLYVFFQSLQTFENMYFFRLKYILIYSDPYLLGVSSFHISNLSEKYNKLYDLTHFEAQIIRLS